MAIEVALILSSVGVIAEPQFTVPLSVVERGGQYVISFEVSAKTDVEVAVVDQTGRVIRHLAAGLLGDKAPEPFMRNSLRQEIVWNGRDDYQRAVTDPKNYRIRVRTGMSTKLEAVAGGDPYAFYSREMGQGDHAAWAITGLEAKSTGEVYVIGNGNNYGPAVLRAYDANGRYKRTLYPPPAGREFEDIKGWGAHLRSDNTYVFNYSDLDTPSPGTTLITGRKAFVAGLVPSKDKDSLTLLGSDFDVMKIHADGTLPVETGSPEKLVARRDSSSSDGAIKGPVYTSVSVDGRYIYLSGVFADGPGRRGRSNAVQTSGFWRDGQVFKIDRTTGKTTVFFSLDENTLIGDIRARGNSPITDSRTTPYAALHGVATDDEGRVFVCDRQNQRILVLEENGQLVKELPVEYPDAIAVNPGTKALYVTSRYGDFHKKGELRLLKFDDWSKSSKPSVNIELLDGVGTYPQPSYLAISHSGGNTLVWTAYTELPVRVYRDTGSGLDLEVDFYQRSGQRALDMQHMIVDPNSEGVYIHDGWGNCFLIADWSSPKFEQCGLPRKPVKKGRRMQTNTGSALGLAIDPHRGHFYTRSPMGAVLRLENFGERTYPQSSAQLKEKVITPSFANNWDIHMGFSDRGMAVAPDGGIAVLGSTRKNDYSGPLHFYSLDSSDHNSEGVTFTHFGASPRSAGVRFDLSGNLYAGKLNDGRRQTRGKAASGDLRVKSTGRIYKYLPTGSLLSGNLYPTAPEAAEKIYDIEFGAIGTRFSRAPYFDVDGYGRIYYPNSLLSRVSAIDTEGNPIVTFGTWGNRDSVGGLAGDIVPTVDIPMAYPSSVGTTDNYIYVSDVVNMRVLRIRKVFEHESLVPVGLH